MRLALLALVLACPAASSAQSLRVPTIAASVAAAADWTTTYHALQHPTIRETNPLLQPWSQPASIVTAGVLMDVAGVTAWRRVVGPKHPRVVAVGLWAMAGFRSYLAVQNVRHVQQVRKFE